MDPASALGLASSIVQLVQFTGDLISKGNEIYKSADGTLIDNLELETIAASLADLSKEVPLLVHTKDRKKSLTKIEKEMQDLCQGCNAISMQLIEVVGELKNKRPPTRWNSFRQALLSVWKESEIAALEKRLERYRRQLDTVLLVSLKKSIEGISALSREDQQASSHLLGERCIRDWKADLIDSPFEEKWQSKRDQDLANLIFSAKLSAGSREERETLDQSRILQKLRFKNMQDRADGIAEAHRKTFNWMFLDEDAPLHPSLDADLTVHPKIPNIGTSKGFKATEAGHPNSSNFVRWLQGPTPLYWITGKPGSGKSTLMKYLHNDPRTRQLLQHWSVNCPLTISAFFFWNSGTEMQMSKLGLLQTLLREAIGSNYGLVPSLFPNRWRSYMLVGNSLQPWSMSELLHAFKVLISDSSRKFFFFIDGLDELDGEGAELANFIQDSVSSRTNVKICVASRPWLVFEDAFQQLPSLRLEALTASDIHLFVTEELDENRMFLALQRLHPHKAERLIMEVTEKASGVFLWVRLVVESLLEGLRDGDTIQDLEDRLLQIPSDLEDLFSKILDRLKPSYFRQASNYFQLVHVAQTPLSLLHLSFAEDELENTTVCEIKQISPQEISFRLETMRRRLSSRCKGLLEAAPSSEDHYTYYVQYLHRTVKDYFSRDEIWRYIVSGSESLNSDLILAGAFMRAIKTMSLSSSTLGIFWYNFQSCTKHLDRLDSTNTHIAIIDELERVGDILFAGLKIEGISHWTKTYPGGEFRPPESLFPSFFAFAVIYPLHTYIQRKLATGCPVESMITRTGESMLFVAVKQQDIRMLDIIFEAGGDPNSGRLGFSNSSAWCQVLWEMLEGNRNLDGWAKIAGLFLDNGADPYALAAYSRKRARVVIESAFGPWEPEKTSELWAKFDAAEMRWKKTSKRKSGTRGLLHFWR